MSDDLNWKTDGMPPDADKPEEKRSRLFDGVISLTDLSNDEVQRALRSSLPRADEGIKHDTESVADFDAGALSDSARAFQSCPSLSPAKGVKHDTGKPDWSLLPLDATEKVVEVLTHGAEKYSRDNWKEVPDAENRYFAAAMRHIVAHRRGEHLDPESGLPHLAHAICCLMFLLERENETATAP